MAVMRDAPAALSHSPSPSAGARRAESEELHHGATRHGLAGVPGLHGREFTLERCG